jgi:type I restriction enzyme, S subunit
MKDKLLPIGWAMSPIGNLCTLNNGRAFKPTEWSDKGLPIVRIQNLNKETATFNYFDGDFEEKYHLKGGELLFAWSGTPGTSFGAHVWRGGEAVLNQHIFRIDIDKSFFEIRFFRHAIDQTLDELIGGAHGGVGLRHVTKGKFENTKILVPPFAEQQRIADKLDTVLARVDACRERLNRVPLILKRFRQSVLAAATSGQLTAEWRQQNVEDMDGGDPAISISIRSPLVIFNDNQVSLPTKWRWERLTSLAKLESGHTPRKSIPEYWENGTIPWISLQDIRLADGKEIFETKYMPTLLGIENSSARLLPKGTVCFCRDISFGYVTIMGREMSTTQHFANWICKEPLIPKYLMYAFMAGRDFLTMSGQGTTVTTIYMPALKELRIATPPVAEQAEIVRRVETLFAFADRLEARLATARAAADRLTPALLAKAFRGELAPQDPNDEPAAELLKRLAVSRTATSDKPRRGPSAKVKKRPSDHPSQVCDS